MVLRLPPRVQHLGQRESACGPSPGLRRRPLGVWLTRRQLVVPEGDSAMPCRTSELIVRGEHDCGLLASFEPFEHLQGFVPAELQLHQQRPAFYDRGECRADEQ